MDNLSEIVNQLRFDVNVFFSGNMCGTHSIGEPGTGHLHMLQSGSLSIITDDGHKIHLDRPSVVFLPGDASHRVVANESKGAQLVCAAVKFGPGQEAFLQSLPRFIYFDGNAHENITRATDWFFDEAFGDKPGRITMLNKLSDIILLQILRHVTEQGLTVHGVLAALVHPQLSRVIKAVQSEPEHPWNLEQLATVAAMSRSKFANIFRKTVGQTPNNYITSLRLAKAKELLSNNKSVAVVANEVGYEHSSALTRVFRKRFGLTPKAWLKERA